MLQNFAIKDEKLAAWLRSNPIADPFKKETPVILINYDNGIFRWPLVPEPIEHR